MADDYRMNHFITRDFRQCCFDGQLGEYMSRQLRAVPKLYVSLLQEYTINDEVSNQDLPSSWTCNVKDMRRWKSSGQFGRRTNVQQFGYVMLQCTSTRITGSDVSSNVCLAHGINKQ